MTERSLAATVGVRSCSSLLRMYRQKSTPPQSIRSTSTSEASITPVDRTPVENPLDTAPSPPSDGASDGRQRHLPIKLAKLLGRGAFGSVYLGVNMANGKLVAVKRVPRALSSESGVTSDIHREVRIMAGLPPHPNVVSYYDSRESGHHVSIVMEYISGGSVAQLLESVKQFHEATIRRYAHMALLGIRHLHANNIVHQDIKGANVLVDNSGTAKIGDFGCCRDLSLTHSLKTGGTPLWMAPEICAGGKPSFASDIWSFGCFILEMAKPDHLPWSNISGGLLSAMYCIGNATQPPELPDTLSDDAKDFVRMCMRIAPAERASAADLLFHPWITRPSPAILEVDDLEACTSATQSLMTTALNSLRNFDSDSDDSVCSDALLMVPAAALGGSAAEEPQGRRLVWASGGEMNVDDEQQSDLLVVETMQPSDSSPRSGRRNKLGESRGFLSKLADRVGLGS